MNVKIPKILFNSTRSVGRTLMKRPAVCLYVNPGGFGLSAAFPSVKLYSHCPTTQNAFCQGSLTHVSAVLLSPH